MNASLTGFGMVFDWPILLGWLLTATVHLCFAVGVFLDATRMQQLQRRGTFLVAGALWAIATLLGGVTVAGVYWLVHHSTLRPSVPRDGSTAPGESK